MDADGLPQAVKEAEEEKTERKTVNGHHGQREVTLVTSPLTQEEAREMFQYRPYSKYSESRFGGYDLIDDIALLLSLTAKRCKMCQAPTKNRYLMEGVCPDCDGRSEYNGTNPRKGSE